VAAAPPAAAEEPPSAVGALDATACRAVFGGAGIQAKNRARREGDVLWLHDDGQDVFVVHSADWTGPAPIRFGGLRLVSAIPGTARFLLTDEAAPPGCPAGIYELGPDASIGPVIRILSVLDGVVLLASGDDLRLLSTKGSAPRTWRLVWRSDFQVARQITYSTSSASKSKRSSSRRRKKKPPPLTKSRSR